VICSVLAGMIALDDGSAAFLAADLDGDGSITGKDAYVLKCIIAGKISS